MSTTPIVRNVSIFNRDFWKGAGERALKSFAQGVVGAPIIITAGAGTTVSELPGEIYQTSTWISALAAGLVMGVLSLITSIANPTFVAGEAVNNHPYAERPEAVAEAPVAYQAVESTSGSSAALSEAPDDDLTPVEQDLVMDVPTERA